MKRPYTAAPGVSLPSISLFNSTPIKSVIVDNPSGGWLYIVELKDFVPPYTLAWSRDLEFSGSAITVQYGVTPAGQISTQQGDPYTVTLVDVPSGTSAGVPSQFIDAFTKFLGIQSPDLPIVNGQSGVLNFNIVPALPVTKRIRVFAVWASNNGSIGRLVNRTLIQFSAFPFISDESPAIARLELDPNHEQDGGWLGQPFDMPVGSTFSVQTFSFGGEAADPLTIDVTYQIL